MARCTPRPRGCFYMPCFFDGEVADIRSDIVVDVWALAKRCIMRHGTDVVVNVRMLPVDDGAHDSRRSLVAVVLQGLDGHWLDLHHRSGTSKKKAPKEEDMHSYFLDGISAKSSRPPTKRARVQGSGVPQRMPSLDPEFLPPASATNDDDDMYLRTVESGDDGDSAWSFESDKSEGLPEPRGCGAHDDNDDVAASDEDDLEPPLGLPSPPPAPVPPDESMHRRRGELTHGWELLPVFSDAGEIIGHLSFNESEKKINAHCVRPEHNVGKTKCHMDRLISSRRKGQGRPLGTLVAWLRDAQYMDDKEDHQLCKSRILSVDSLVARMEARAWLKAKPEFQRLFRMERVRREDEESEPEVAA